MTAWWTLGRGKLSRDLALAGGLFVGGLLLLALGTYGHLNPSLIDTSPVVSYVTLAASCVAVALRRVATRAGLALATAAIVADLACGSSLATTLVYTQVLFDSCVYGSPRLWRRLLWITVALTAAAGLLGVVLRESWEGIALSIPVVLVGVLPVVSGISVRQYRDQAAAERARAEQTARLAELDRRQAVAAERSRMARELHDVIANHLSAVAIHATAALSVPSLDRAQLDRALRVIRENSVQGLAEMRQMINLLREPAEPGPEPIGAGSGRADADVSSADRSTPPSGGPAPGEAAVVKNAGPGPDRGTTPGADQVAAAPGGADPATEMSPVLGSVDGAVRTGLAEVDRLVHQARGVGLTVRRTVTGEPRPLPVGVDLAAYRIVQESLTNALKHGSGRAELSIDYLPDAVRLVIENPLPDRPGPNRPPAAELPGASAGLPGAGAGLIGMRERATLLHGRFEAGRQGSRWRVLAQLPLDAATPEPAGVSDPGARR